MMYDKSKGGLHMSNIVINKDKQIFKLQQNLSSIRKIAGWTMQDLGDKIGLTKQTISNLENRKTSMTLTQYIAIRKVLDDEIESNNSNELLSKVVGLLIDNSDQLDDESYIKAQEVVDTVAASAVSGTPNKNLKKFFDVLIMSIPVIATIGVAIFIKSKNWLKFFK